MLEVRELPEIRLTRQGLQIQIGYLKLLIEALSKRLTTDQEIGMTLKGGLAKIRQQKAVEEQVLGPRSLDVRLEDEMRGTTLADGTLLDAGGTHVTGEDVLQGEIGQPVLVDVIAADRALAGHQKIGIDDSQAGRETDATTEMRIEQGSTIGMKE